MNNPFETINDRLSRIEGLLSELKHPVKETQQEKPTFKYIPIQEIFDKRICSKPTFYNRLREGQFTLYKFGNRSFVDLHEFQQAFHKVKMREDSSDKDL